MYTLVFVSFDQHKDFKKHKDFAKANNLIFKNRTSSSLDEIKFCAKYKTIVLPQLLVFKKNKLECRFEFWPSKDLIEAARKGDFSLDGIENPCYRESST